jgi:hypothetical protein
MKKRSNIILTKGGEHTTTTSLLAFQQKQLKELESKIPISQETGYLLDLVLTFLNEARDLKVKPQPKSVAERKLKLLQNKMTLLNQVSATGKELLQ